jgi:hypothetical protein
MFLLNIICTFLSTLNSILKFSFHLSMDSALLQAILVVVTTTVNGAHRHMQIFTVVIHMDGYAVVKLVEALCYKLEGCGFDSRWYHRNFSLT